MEKTQLKPEDFPNGPSLKTLKEIILRVDLAGEWGAKRIYEGQLWALRRSQAPLEAVDAIEHMYQQECAHVIAFEDWARRYHVRPTLLAPFWHWGAWALGAGTALCGVSAAMVCTVAVEEVIDEHYRQQIQTLGDQDHELSGFLEQCRQDEVAHQDLATTFLESQQHTLFALLKKLVHTVTRTAISFSKTI